MTKIPLCNIAGVVVLADQIEASIDLKSLNS